MATYKDGHFYCEYHGDLGEHDAAIENETVLYSGEDQQNGFFCTACLGEDATARRPSSKPELRPQWGNITLSNFSEWA